MNQYKTYWPIQDYLINLNTLALNHSVELKEWVVKVYIAFAWTQWEDLGSMALSAAGIFKGHVKS